MSRIISFLLACFCMFLQTTAETYKSNKIRPRWISELPNTLNKSYTLEVTFVDMASNLEGARQASKKELYNMIAKRENIEVQEGYDYKSQQQGSGEQISERSTDIYTMQIKTQGEVVDLVYKKLDEYWIEVRRGSQTTFQLYTLYAVSRSGMSPSFHEISLTEKYGIAPVLMSLVPGAGQMYKGSYLKGGCILGAEIACVAGIILCENQRADYANKVIEQPRFAKEYNTKANNWATGRNLAIGVAGALYVYNLIDAAVTNGARRVKLKPVGSAEFSCNPCILSDGLNQLSAGLQLSLNF